VNPRLGVVVLPEHRWPRAREIWTALERSGVRHAWTFDHYSWRTLHDAPWYDSVTTLAAIAAVTRTIRIGTLVSTPNFRHPALLAKQAMTLDEISGGRFLLGLGAGAPGPDARLLGSDDLPPRARAARFGEFVELVDALLRNRETTYRGRYFDAVGAPVVPGCVQRPRVPFAIAASGPRGLALTARYAETWVTIGDTARPGATPEAVAFGVLEKQLHALEAACAQAGRDVAELGKLVNVSRIVADPYGSPERFLDVLGRCAALGFTDVVVNHPRADEPFRGGVAEFERALAAADAS
jgi:alkanesulfonate monooxygenase SsuD/methylene tetrahydromethanopterin reductase-like flavin-dependent oxidoreductase (luciferase family)